MHTTSCAFGSGMCVSLKHGLVIVSEILAFRLHMHSLANGSLVRSIGGQNAHGKRQFDFDRINGRGGLCITPDGDSVLVADDHRLQEVNIMDGSWVRFVGQGALRRPFCMDCNTKFIVVSEDAFCLDSMRISVFSWGSGNLVSQFNKYGCGWGQMINPLGVRLMGDGRELVVVDSWNKRLCVFRLDGEFVWAMGNKELGLLSSPNDVLVCEDGFIVVNQYESNLVKLSIGGDLYGGKYDIGYGHGGYSEPTAVAALPDGGMVVLCLGRKFEVFRGLGLRVAWIATCVLLA